MRKLIVNGDDFGFAVPVNEAIELAHRHGILSSASLMVGAPASEDAVRRARELPTLKVGLHVVVVQGRPVLPPQSVPHLVNERGEFSTDLFSAAMGYFFNGAARRELAAEIEAQFDAFLATGLPLDHVNAHNHMHLHPTVLRLIVQIGRKKGLKALRVPYEPARIAWRGGRRKKSVNRALAAAALAIWARLLRGRVRRWGLRCNDFVLGLHDSGSLDEDMVLELLSLLPQGITELYFHPATRRDPAIDRAMPGYLVEAEYRALTSPRIREFLAAGSIQRMTFSEI